MFPEIATWTGRGSGLTGAFTNAPALPVCMYGWKRSFRSKAHPHMPRDPFIREKFTRGRSAAKKLAAEYFQCFPKDRYQTEGRELAPSAIAKHRIHHEAAARADRWRRLIGPRLRKHLGTMRKLQAAN
jgi:hypothetical protein